MSPAYIADVASARYRGRLATVQQMAIICGLRGVNRAAVAGPRGLALDVLDAGATVRAVPAAVAGDSGKPALPGAEGAAGACEGGAVAAVRRRRGGGQAGRDRSQPGAGSAQAAFQ
ncbi:hypothetical protein G6F24_015823 [Rhizopus arrhizus]|nr:hypothetical protein G6F24_015823 [Rhizopus arrhizus]